MKTILVALDGSSRAPEVLQGAASLARSLESKLVLFRAVGIPHDLPREAFTLSPDGVVSLLEEQARRELGELASAASMQPAEIRVAVGSAWEAICREAREVDAALIVIGSHGYGSLDRVLGTTAARVVNHADRSVLVVRAHDLLRVP